MARYCVGVITLFVVFSVGLNLGFHGILHTSYPTLVAPKEATIEIAVPIVTQEAHVQESIEEAKLVHVVVTQEPMGDNKQREQVQAVDTILNKILVTSRVSNMVEEYMLGTALSKNEPITQYIVSQKKLPIVLLTCNRPELLRSTLESLLKVKGVASDNLLVIQDGTMEEVASIINQNKLQLIQNTNGIRLRAGQPIDGAARIAQHYKFALTAAFDHFKFAPAIIIVEDDLLFAPDFLDYFENVSPIVEKDDSVFVVSAWNDNGFKERIGNPHKLYRTEFFPGLGWLLPRALYKNELEAKWPNEHWDHWLRSAQVHKNRAIVYPQVPRTYHNGIKGTFMNLDTHNRYFKNIGICTDPTISWKPIQFHAQMTNIVMTVPHYMFSRYSVYSAIKSETRNACHHATSIQDLLAQTNQLVCLWINVNTAPNPYRPPDFEPIAKFFGIWHEYQRGSYENVHEFYWESNYIHMVNVFNNALGNMDKPATVPSLPAKDFDINLLADKRRKSLNLKTFTAVETNQNCDDVCTSHGLSCDESSFPYINTCSALNEVFQCKECTHSNGYDQPAIVVDISKKNHGQCLIASNLLSSSCRAKHASTRRLCVCK